MSLAGGGKESSVPTTRLYLKTRGQWGPPYHLATDCGLQRIHQLCRDADEVVVVGLDPVVPFQVRHGPPLGFYQLLVELLQHV